jgi:hypothetical protein
MGRKTLQSLATKIPNQQNAMKSDNNLITVNIIFHD